MCRSWPISAFLSDELGEAHLVRLTTPAHRDNSSLPKPLSSLAAQSIEIVDTPYIPKTVWAESEQMAASHYNTALTCYFPGGTSYAVMAGLHAAFSTNDNILVARNIHQSVLSALILIKVGLQWICPDQPWFIFDPNQVEEALAKDSSITGVVLTNPSYEGHCSDIGAIAEVCRQKRVKLIVDESLGAHWVGWESFPTSALQLGADLVFHSLHKRVGALVPASLLHVPKGSALDCGFVEQYARLFRSTSPSNMVLASTERCIMTHFSEAASAHANTLVGRVEVLRDDIRNFQHQSAKTIPRECQEPLVVHFVTQFGDPTELADIVYDLGFDYEHADARGLIYFVSPQESYSSFSLFADNFLKIICDRVGPRQEVFSYVIPRIVMSPLDALRSPAQTIPLDAQLVGRISADLVTDCPPGIPILMPGEEITPWHCSQIGKKRIRIVTVRS